MVTVYKQSSTSKMTQTHDFSKLSTFINAKINEKQKKKTFTSAKKKKPSHSYYEKTSEFVHDQNLIKQSNIKHGSQILIFSN